MNRDNKVIRRGSDQKHALTRQIEGSVEDGSHFLLMVNLATSSDRARGVAASIDRILVFMMFCLASGSVNAGTNITPSPIVERFLLTPNQVRIGILVKVGSDQVVREWRELFDPTDGDVFDASIFTRLSKGKVDLACAENMRLDFFRRNEGRVVRIRQISEEVGITNHLLEIGACFRMAQEVL